MTSQPYSFVFALLLLSLTLLVAGCDQLASSELERADGDSALATPNGAKGPMARGPMASGHILAKFQSQSFTASFNARTRHGATSGMIELHARSLGARVHGTIDCLRVENNEAWMSGVITQGNFDDDAPFVTPPGTKFWFRVLDDGEGAASTDQYTGIATDITTPVNDCTSDFVPLPGDPEFVPPYLDNEGGNIQVR